jgi:hypothetical protein
MHKSINIWYLLLAITAFLLYGFLIGGWWYGDDPEIVVFASKHSPFEYLFNPSVWQSFSPFNLTPWILLSLNPDILFSDFNPSGYYLHQMFALFIVSLIFFKVLNLFTENRVIALTAVLIFLLTPATFSVASWLSARHYLEGMGFSLLSIYFFVKGMRNSKMLFILISALFHTLASVSKEVYVPLPFLLLLLPEKTFKNRLMQAIPLFTVSVLYFFYRMEMLGDNPLGGYSSIWPWTPGSALVNFKEIFRLYAGSWLVFFPVLITIILNILLYKDWKAGAREISRYILVFLIFFIPVLPVSSILSSGESLRYIFIISALITSFYILSLDRIWNKGSRVYKTFAGAGLIIVVICFFYSYKEQRNVWHMKRAQASTEGKFFIGNSGSLDAIFRISQPHWFYDGLEKMEEEHMNEKIQRKIRLVVDGFYGFERNTSETISALQVFAYDINTGNITDISEEARAVREDFLRRVKDKPLEVLIEIQDNTMQLQLNPYDGQYILLEASPAQPDFYYLAFPVNKNFGIKLTHREKVRIFRFAYKSPEGWITLSPEFLIDRSKDRTIKWSRL